MSKSKRLRVVLAFLWFVTAASNAAQDDSTRILYLIYDSSNSMWGSLADGQRKYEAARQALSNFASTQKDRPMALRVYGARSKDDCRDSHLEVRIGSSRHKQIEQAVVGVRPTGQTPIDYSLRAALGDIGDQSADIVVITDGIESCDADPCALLEKWRKSQANISVHVVGLGLGEREKQSMQCFADATGNPILDAQSGAELNEALGNAITRPRQVDFGFVADDAAGASTELQIFADGKLIPIEGQDNLSTLTVESHHRYTPAAGQYVLEAGVRTASGERYTPVRVPVDLTVSQRITISPPLPPMVSASFHDGIEPLRSPTRVEVWQGDDRIGGFSSRTSLWLMPGVYELRAQPDRLNSLTKNITLKAGDRPTIAFTTKRTAKIFVEFVSQQTGKRIKNNPKLWQNGEEQGAVLGGNGGVFFSGEYTARIHDGLMPYEANLTVTAEARQEFTIEVPTGQVNVEYQDSNGETEKARRVFIYSLTDSVTRQSAKPLTLMPGQYRLQGHPRDEFSETTISVSSNSTQTVVLRRNPG